MDRVYDGSGPSGYRRSVQQQRSDSRAETHELVESVPKTRSPPNTTRVLAGGGFERAGGETSSIRFSNRGHRRNRSSRQSTDPINETDSQTNMGYVDEQVTMQEASTQSVSRRDTSEKDENTMVQSQTLHRDNIDADSESVRSENTFVTPRDLGTFDVAALIINKQIGTGIFTTPGLVLGLAGSKSISIVMWICGGLWAFLSILIYVEFGAAFPFNGGELIYLDEVFRRPELLSAALFSAFFITLSTTAGNSIQFAKHILLAAEPDVTDTHQFDKRLLSYIAVTVLTLTCLIHYFSRNSGLLLNLLFASFKIFLVIAFIIGGFLASKKPDNGRHDWGTHNDPLNSQGSTSNAIAGMIYVIYSYQGWENANYVGGELKVARSSLKRGAFLAVGFVTILYTLVTSAFYYALKYEDLVDNDLAIIVNLVPKAFGESSVFAIKICIALSAFGNLVAVVYTSAKVKQQIARQCIIPFSRFFAAEDPVLRTPYGALILHWVFAVVWIVCTPNTSQGYGLVIGLFIYGQLVIGVLVSFAFFFIRRNYETGLTRNSAYNSNAVKWEPVILKNKIVRVVFCAIPFMAMNVLVLVESSRVKSTPPSWIKPAVVFSILGVATLLWAGLRLIASKSGPESSIEIRILRDGIEEPSPKDFPILQKAKLEGNTRVVIYEVHGRLQRILQSLDVYFHKTVKLLGR